MKRAKQVLAILLVLAMVLMMLPAAGLAQPYDVSFGFVDGGRTGSKGASAFGGGDGSQTTPYLIADETQLTQLASDVNNGENYSGKHFKVIQDIALTAASWTPIGKENVRAFKGSFDGNNKRITGISIVASSVVADIAFGLFGFVSDGEVKNVHVAGCIDVSGDRIIDAGGVAGYIQGTTILDSCTSAVRIDIAFHAEEESSCAGGDVAVAGGLVGCSAAGTTVRNCASTAASIRANATYNSGAVYAYAGGIIGRNLGKVQNCYSTAQALFSQGAYAPGYAGGIAGYNGTNSQVQNCYSTTTTVTGSGGYLGGVVGENRGTVQYCYWNCINESGIQTGVGMGEGYGSTANLIKITIEPNGGNGGTLETPVLQTTSLLIALNAGQAKFSAGSSLKGWVVESDSTYQYPVFDIGTWTDVGNYDLDWYTGKSSPYTIGTNRDLAGLAVLVNGMNGETADGFQGDTINLAAEIDLSAHKWAPIGVRATGVTPFCGTFHGNNKAITGMLVAGGYTVAGLFGDAGNETVAATIKNVDVAGVIEVSAANAAGAGGVVGRIEGGSLVDGCASAVRIAFSQTGATQGSAVAGGVVGSSAHAQNTIQNCSSAAPSILASGGAGVCAGGIVGDNVGCVLNCYNAAQTISAAGGSSSCAGGIAGKNAGDVKNCYSTAASVTATGQDTNCMGGVVGSGSEHVQYCYWTGPTESGEAYPTKGVGEEAADPDTVKAISTAPANGNGGSIQAVVIGAVTTPYTELLAALQAGKTAVGATGLKRWEVVTGANSNYPVFGNNCTIAAFALPGQIGSSVIDDAKGTIAVTLPAGTNVSNLTPATFTTDPANASVTPAKEASQNFTNPVAYTVSADGLNSKVYTVTVQHKSTDCDITSFAIEGQQGATVIDEKAAVHPTIAVTLPYGMDLTNLTPTIATSADATVAPANGVAQDFSSSETTPVLYTVTAEAGNAKVYAVTATNAPLSAPVASLANGRYFEAQSVVLRSPVTGAEIYYTTDGSVPNPKDAKQKYTAAITVDKEMTLQAIAQNGTDQSEVVTFTYVVRALGIPTASPVGGSFVDRGEVALTTEEDATILYSLDGSAPSIPYTDTFTLTQTCKLQAVSVLQGKTSAVASWNFTVIPKVVAPAFAPVAGTYGGPQLVSLTCDTPDAAIYYTTDGKTSPSTQSTLYTCPFVVEETATLRARAYKDGYAVSNEVCATYTIQNRTGGVAVNPGSGVYAQSQSVALSTALPDAQIRYTTDGSVPTLDCALYENPITLPEGATVLNAQVFVEGIAVGDMSGFAYVIGQQVQKVYATPHVGIYYKALQVTLGCNTPDAAIYYTTDGSDPKVYGKRYTAPIAVEGVTTVNAYAAREGYVDSDISTFDYAAYADFLLGDADLNGVIQARDSMLVLSWAAHGNPPAKNSQAFLSADVNKDGKLTTADALWILQKALGNNPF